MDYPLRRDSSRDTEPDANDSTTPRRRVLRTSAGLIAATVGGATLVGQVAAHFPEDLEIDIKPGSEHNSIDPACRGVIPVAVLQTDEFDPTNEAARYRFGAPDVVEDGGGAQPIHGGHAADVNGDGQDDLVLLFPIDEAGFDGDETEGRLEWEEDETGEHGLSGTDTVTIVDSSYPRWTKRGGPIGRRPNRPFDGWGDRS